MHSDAKPIAELLSLVTAIETYQQSLEARRERKPTPSESLDPSTFVDLSFRQRA